MNLWRTVQRLYYGWRMIAVGSVIRILGGGLHIYGFTVFFLPLSQDLGISRAATSLAFSLARAEGAIEGPLAGYLIDRWGPRPVMVAAIALSGIGYMLMAGVESYFTFLLVYLGLISLSFSAGFMHAPMVLANTWFVRRRGMAMTAISMSVPLGGTLISPLLALAIYQWGWRWGALLAGLGVLAIGLPLSLLVRRSPESMGLLPDGDPPERQEKFSGGAMPPENGGSKEGFFTLKEAMGTTAFWMMTLATLVRITAFNTMMVHFIPVMVWKGMTQQQGAFLLGGFALMSLACHVLIGWLADHLYKPRLMATCMLVAAVATLALIYTRGEWGLWVFAALFTVAESIFPVTWATVGDFFGRRYFATIRGMMSFFYPWGSVAGPVVAGAIYDQTRSYGLLLWVMLALFLAAAFLYASLVKPTRGRATAAESSP